MMIHNLYRALAATALILGTVSADPVQTVELDYGTFAGAYNTKYNLSYWGKIPFAAPPLGANRFRAPQPPLNQTSLYNSTTTFSACPYKIGYGAEDCLYLGVWGAPWEEGQPLKPVVVWYYGGAYIEGSSSVGMPPNLFPTANVSIAGSDIIWVFPNYRTNTFGFLPGKEVAKDPESDLNVGLLDQQAVLKWVNKNIAKFGGDPKNVGIWGQSAGGGSVVAQVLADGGNLNLFNKALASSPFWPKTYKYDEPDAQKIYDEMVSLSGCSNATSTLACLKSADLLTLQTAAWNVSYSQTYTTSSYTWAPVIDGTFLKQTLTEATARGAVNIQYGWGTYNQHEGENFIPPGLANAADSGTPPFNSSTASFDNWVSGFLPRFTKEDVKNLYKVYPAEGTTETLSYNTSYTRAGLIYRDIVLACPAYWTAGAAHKTSYIGEYTISPAKHGSDTVWWDTVTAFQTNSTYVYDGFVGAFASFLNSGDPNKYKITNSSTVGVPNLNTGKEFVVETNGFENLKLNQLETRCNFWKSVAPRVPI